jgi:hypothetical protein
VLVQACDVSNGGFIGLESYAGCARWPNEDQFVDGIAHVLRQAQAVQFPKPGAPAGSYRAAYFFISVHNKHASGAGGALRRG